MPQVDVCYPTRVSSASFDRYNRGTYAVEWRVRSDVVLGDKQLINAALFPTQYRGDKPGFVADPPAGSELNIALPNFGEDYDLRGVYANITIDSTPIAEYDPYSYAQSYRIKKRDESLKFALIEVTYTPLEPGDSKARRQSYAAATPSSPAPTLPWRRGPVWTSSDHTYTRIVDKDASGSPIVNAAGKSFDRPPTIQESEPVLIAQFNVERLDYVLALQNTYPNRVNSAAWDLTIRSASADAGTTYPLSFPARTARCLYVRPGPEATEGDRSFYPTTAAFAIKSSTWDLEILNEGYGYLESAGGAYKKATDSDGAVVSEPDLLAADGTKLAPGVVGNFITVQAYAETDFGANPSSTSSLAYYLAPAS